MATAFAANGPVETATIGGASEVSARQLTISAPLDADSTAQSTSSPLPSPRINLPPPNPPFTFPARPSSSSAPSTFSRSTGRRPHSAIELKSRPLDFANEIEDRPTRSPALPEFCFNPGATLGPNNASRNPRSPNLPDFSFNPGVNLESDESLLSPPLTPQSPRGSQLRNGHRRGGSEFVGGKLKVGESITVMNTSPTRSESGFASPKLSPTDIPPRRGHAHRRSAAISSHDLSMILKPNNSPTSTSGTSAQTSPVEFGDELRASRDQPSIEPPKIELNAEEPAETKIEETPIQRSLEASPIAKAAGRTRVGFSDKLEFIPRPLSMTSTDTSSTTTARPGHKFSGSISSIISMTNSTATDREQPSLLGSPVSSTKNSSRPSTAGAILERTPSLHGLDRNSASPRRRNSIPLLIGLSQEDDKSPANPSPTKTPKRWSFFGLESFASSGSPIRPRLGGSNSPDSTSKPPESADLPSEQGQEPNLGDAVAHAKGRKVPGKSKKQKKVKSWAGSILTRKSKSRTHKKSARRRSQTPPLRRLHLGEDVYGDQMDLPEPLTTPVVLVTEPPPSENDTEASMPSRTPDDDTPYPVIDLDAALGPFNTPLARDPQWEEAQRAGAPPKRQLHSAAGMRGFSGPGMHYHRRAESAPEMPPFEAARFGIHRFNSSSTMADVFEEDEEDVDDSENSLSDGSTPEAQEGSGDEVDVRSDTDDAASTPTQERDLGIASSQDSLHSISAQRKGSGSSLEVQPVGSRMRSETSTNSLHEEIIAEEPTWPPSERTPSIPGFSENFDLTAPSSRVLNNDDSASIELSPATIPTSTMLPVSPYSTSHSSFPSPRSPMSYDARRISTTPSSVTDENNYHSLLMGEPGPELVRMSVEVPSLTSSNSTMTRESMFTPGVRPRNMPFHEQRPASFTSAFGRRRSSLASLSRLISSAHGERSKLSMEVPCESEPDKKSKPSKSKRLGRMMQFWKPKGSTES
ncbi:hypothetical protein F5B20DRAFT_485766 [Whalleya microplaca]|nr:hypothetical protein F5B20DRAFT_485766 [Whalleya microplaca]